MSRRASRETVLQKISSTDKVIRKEKYDVMGIPLEISSVSQTRINTMVNRIYEFKVILSFYLFLFFKSCMSCFLRSLQDYYSILFLNILLQIVSIDIVNLNFRCPSSLVRSSRIWRVWEPGLIIFASVSLCQ